MTAAIFPHKFDSMKQKIIVTGANGQVGQCLQMATRDKPEYEWIFCTSVELDITSEQSITDAFSGNAPAVVINLAAYTAVDKAEDEAEKAFLINSLGVKLLSQACHNAGTILIHVSTDYVFDGKKTTPYFETDPTDPLTIYGQSKLGGELEILQHCPNSVIIRTSWVYSEFGNNFVKTMLKLGSERESLTVVTDQIGNPTSAHDLAQILVTFAKKAVEKTVDFGMYHYSNTGGISWFDFAAEIMTQANLPCLILPTTSDVYVQKAPRPRYSVLDTTKAEAIGVEIKEWKTSLARIIKTLS